MKITNEDKIALMELLGIDYKYSLYTLDSSGNQEYGSVRRFNPLDISILMKALDIIEKKHNHSTEIRFCRETRFTKAYYDCVIGNGVWNSDSNILTKEETILKAILQYIKTKEK